MAEKKREKDGDIQQRDVIPPCLCDWHKQVKDPQQSDKAACQGTGAARDVRGGNDIILKAAEVSNDDLSTEQEENVCTAEIDSNSSQEYSHKSDEELSDEALHASICTELPGAMKDSNKITCKPVDINTSDQSQESSQIATGLENIEGNGVDENFAVFNSESLLETSGDERTSISLHSIDEDFDEDSSLCLESFEAYYLEENPLHEQGWDDLVPPLNADSENDSEDSSDDSSEDDEEQQEQEDGAVADFGNAEMQAPLVMQNNLTKGDLILLILATAQRHKKTFQSILDEFQNLNLLYGHDFFPGSKDKLYSILQLNRIGLKAHVYCGNAQCGEYIGIKDRLGDMAVCHTCNTQVPIQKACFFVDLDLRNQLKRFLCIPGIWNYLQYRETRVKTSPTALEDIYDAEYYKRLRLPGGPLHSPYSFSYVFSTDGCRPSKKGKLKIWPIFLRINELPPSMRQKFHFLVALYVGKCDPNFQTFLKPFVAQANRLSSAGIMWKPDGLNEVRSTFIPYCHCVDAPARSAIHEMVTYSGNFGCTYCTHEGRYIAGAVRFPPFLPDGQPAFEDRTHAGMVEGMLQAHDNGAYMGHKGLTQLILLDHFDLREGQAADDLHPDHEGCAKHITELLLAEAPTVNEDLLRVDLVQIINDRLLSIKTPSRISRKPSKINGTFNGSEWRNWLLFYGPPCLDGLIQPQYVEVLSQLSYACYLLSQDVIEPHDIDEADRLLKNFATNVNDTFGLSKMKFNLHATTAHKVRSVQQLGPPWSYSTYNFESLHSQLMKKITSPKGTLQQVVTRFLLQQTVSCAMYSEEIPELVRERLHEITSKHRLSRVTQVDIHTYAVAKAIPGAPSPIERVILTREGHHVEEFEEFKSMLHNGTRYWSANHRNEDIKSDDSFIYTHQNTFCTIQKIILFRNDVGEQNFGLMVTEHDVARHLGMARHISVLRDEEANLLHYIAADVIKCPAIKMKVDDIVYAVALPNCYEID